MLLFAVLMGSGAAFTANLPFRVAELSCQLPLTSTDKIACFTPPRFQSWPALPGLVLGALAAWVMVDSAAARRRVPTSVFAVVGLGLAGLGGATYQVSPWTYSTAECIFVAEELVLGDGSTTFACAAQPSQTAAVVAGSASTMLVVGLLMTSLVVPRRHRPSTSLEATASGSSDAPSTSIGRGRNVQH